MSQSASKRHIYSYDMLEVRPNGSTLTEPDGDMYFCSARCLHGTEGNYAFVGWLFNELFLRIGLYISATMRTRSKQLHGSPIEPPTGSARLCFLPAIPEITLAAQLLENATTAHLLGHKEKADQLIRMADMPEIRKWVDSIWGKASSYIQYRSIPDSPPHLDYALRAKNRMPSKAEKRLLLERDGYHCRFCHIPLIRSEIRALLRTLYPAALQWGGTNATQHAAFQAMWVQYDHILPHARGGANDLENLIITCGPCNFGRMNYTLDEVCLEDPRNRETFRSDWDGLERLLHEAE